MVYKFLIIDDNQTFRERLKRLLQADWEGAEVDEIDPGTHGLPKEDIAWEQYDLLFLDDVFSKKNGVLWFAQLRENPACPAVIVFSNHPAAEVAVKAIKAGAENYLPKQALTRRKLNHAIKDILQQAKARRVPQEYLNLQNSDLPKTAEPEAAHPPDDERRGWPEVKGHRLLKKIGQGGMSVIYLAERIADGAKLVIKTLSMNLLDNRKTLTRSNQEFKLISRINNPHIARLYEHGTVGDAMYTTMEYFPGGDLKQRLRKGITQRQALQYLLQIADGLAAIHGCGIIHRDLKPANIMFRKDETLAIIDFGISKDINTQLDLTDPGQVMGTPNYMAPEQGNGGYRPDARSDIYSVGVMLYEMLTGNKPYAAPTGAAIIYKHLHEPIPRLPNQFFEMQQLLDIMMAKYPQQRFQSALDMIEYINKEFRWDITLDFT